MTLKKSKLFVAAIILCLAATAALFGYIKEKNAVVEDRTDANNTSEKADFEIHFIDVGQADSALIMCDGKNMLIDGGNSDDSSTVYSYLKNEGVTELEYIIATHAHEDHVGGLSGALNFATAKTALSPVTEYDSKAFSNFLKNLDKQELEITVPDVGDEFYLGSARVNVLACNSSEGTNNSSIVLKIEYGDTSFLFTGDAEYETEAFILEHGFDISSTLLKVGHHGSSSSTGYRFLWEVMPQYAVISVGKNNDYGHPHDEVVSRLADADVTVYRTDLSGDIVCTSDGKTLSFDFPNKKQTSNQQKHDMVLNTASKKYHTPDCESIKSIKEKNRQNVRYTISEVEALGYLPCGSCH